MKDTTLLILAIAGVGLWYASSIGATPDASAGAGAGAGATGAGTNGAGATGAGTSGTAPPGGAAARSPAGFAMRTNPGTALIDAGTAQYAAGTGTGTGASIGTGTAGPVQQTGSGIIRRNRGGFGTTGNPINRRITYAY